METQILLKTLFDKFQMNDEDRAALTFYYHFGLLAYLNTIVVGEVNGQLTAQKYLLN